MKDRSKLGVLSYYMGWVLVMVGLLLACTVVNGSELPWLCLLAPLFGFGSLVSVVQRFQGDKLLLRLFLCIVAYFLLRAYQSPVWDFARRDSLLIILGVVAFFVASAALRDRLCCKILVIALILLLFGNVGISVYQAFVDPSYAFLRIERLDQKGVSGFFYHRNYLAGFLSLTFPVLLGVSMSAEGLFRKAGFLIATLACAGLCFYTNSRGGFGAMLLGGFVTGAFLMGRKGWLRGKSRLRSRVGAVAGVMFVLILAFVSKTLFTAILDNRGQAVATALEGRLAMAGIAIDVWTLEPVFGSGSHSFSFLFPKNFVGLGHWFGNANMAHSHYLQCLADYGIIGLALLVFMILATAFRLLQKPSGSPEGQALEGSWLKAAALGVLVSEVFRAIFDFNLYIAPNFILFAILLGGGTSMAALDRRQKTGAQSGSESSSGDKGSLISDVTLRIGVTVVALYGLWIALPEVRAARSWITVESQSLKGDPVEESLRNFVGEAPSFVPLRRLARISLSQARSSEGDAAAFQQASEDWRKVVERHPLDGESLANYARCLDELQKFDEAEVFHLRALEALYRREHKYGVLYNIGWHLIRRGDAARRERRAGEALFLYQEAAEVFEESRSLNFGRRQLIPAVKRAVGERIDFLEGARIDPVEVPILAWRSAVD